MSESGLAQLHLAWHDQITELRERSGCTDDETARPKKYAKGRNRGGGNVRDSLAKATQAYPKAAKLCVFGVRNLTTHPNLSMSEVGIP